MVGDSPSCLARSEAIWLARRRSVSSGFERMTRRPNHSRQDSARERRPPFGAALGIVLTLSVTPAFADGLKDDVKSYESEHYTKAKPATSLAAERGDAGAQFTLGFMYQYGKGVALSRR